MDRQWWEAMKEKAVVNEHEFSVVFFFFLNLSWHISWFRFGSWRMLPWVRQNKLEFSLTKFIRTLTGALSSSPFQIFNLKGKKCSWAESSSVWGWTMRVRVLLGQRDHRLPRGSRQGRTPAGQQGQYLQNINPLIGIAPFCMYFFSRRFCAIPVLLSFIFLWNMLLLIRLFPDRLQVIPYHLRDMQVQKLWSRVCVGQITELALLSAMIVGKFSCVVDIWEPKKVPKWTKENVGVWNLRCYLERGDCVCLAQCGVSRGARTNHSPEFCLLYKCFTVNCHGFFSFRS